MDNLTISIFGNKIFFEIINELNFFSKFKIKYYEDIDLCIKDAEREQFVAIFFLKKSHINLIKSIKKNKFASIFINEFYDKKNINLNEFADQINMPFSIFEFERKVISVVAKNQFNQNSLIKLESYIIDKNERKIKKNSLELQLSEKEINFLILFSKTNKPISKNLVLKKVWKYSLNTETHTVETHIHRLRKKILKKFGDDNFIKNNTEGYYI